MSIGRLELLNQLADLIDAGLLNLTQAELTDFNDVVDLVTR